MRAFWSMVRANVRMSVRNRTALFWNLAFPAIFILIFGAVFGNDAGITFDVAVTGDPSPTRDAALAALRDNDAFTVSTGAAATELAALEDGERDIVIVFAAEAADQTTVPPLDLYSDATDGPNEAVAVGAVRQVLTAAIGQGPPLAITERRVSSEAISFIDFFVPGILAMSLMNSGVIGLSTAFVTYRERGILRRIKVTPFPIGRFILARVVSQLLVAVAQSLILAGMASLLFDLTIRGNPLIIFVVIVTGALAFLAIGFAISSFARNTESAASYANLVTFPMLFLSGVFLSVDSAPAWLQPVTRLLPLRYLVDALREPMNRGRGFEAIWLDLFVLVGTFAVAMAIAIRFFRWDARAS